MFGSKSEEFDKLLTSLAEANKAVGKLEAENKHQKAEMASLKIEAEKDRLKIQRLESELDSQKKVVKETLGLNLNAMTLSGANAMFTQRSLSFFEIWVKPKIAGFINNLDLETFWKDETYKPYFSMFPDANIKESFSEQSVKTQENATYMMMGMKSFIAK